MNGRTIHTKRFGTFAQRSRDVERRSKMEHGAGQERKGLLRQGISEEKGRIYQV